MGNKTFTILNTPDNKKLLEVIEKEFGILYEKPKEKKIEKKIDTVDWIKKNIEKVVL